MSHTYLHPDTVEAIATIYRGLANSDQSPGSSQARSWAARMNGLKRRQIGMTKIAFVKSLALPDTSIHAVRAVMVHLWGEAVGNASLLEWATPGRKANDRVDIPALIGSLGPHVVANARSVLVEVAAEFERAKTQARERIEPMNRATRKAEKAQRVPFGDLDLQALVLRRGKRVDGSGI